MNPRLDALQPYPFEKLARLVADVTPNPDRSPISLAIGEPQHPPAACARTALVEHLDGIAHYPPTRGGPALREAISDWLINRFNVPAQWIDPERHILPAAGTREALFSFAQALIDDRASPTPRVAMPNPGYQIYEGAALLAGAQPLYLPCLPETGFLADLDAPSAADWDRVQLLYLCSPGNPTGAVADLDYFKQALALADRHDFVIASDECYSEIYPDESAPPPGLLQAAAETGRDDFSRCVVFHSLSKRSNLPGLRSGFVAGDARVLADFVRYRTYHGATLGAHVQAASIAAWRDEAHVRANRDRYREKYDAVMPRLAPFCDVARPAGAFYLWPAFDADDEALTVAALRDENLRVVPGRYLAREVNGVNPGRGRLRLSLVADTGGCVEAVERLARVCEARTL
ncbi:succinyldiaminopimelate aminotransferase [Salinisphaera orenii MK-B5]|uniref:Succinyldiaminopimelate aminotransferase n=1 Tax=Salinisphaera orenii MK-B5 TaxID=856730 RepID=A0A423PXJ8_9GAMM|nr:succinyldiaminopimelate transaminase [Salinisphaera orenii]ROO30343.1 succinyldiaminopimelate aminotransferase [Salinisphaera orenii MK-B5]